MKNFKLITSLSLVTVLFIGLNACKKKDDPVPTIANADLAGVYIGNWTHSSGTNSDTMTITLKSGATYNVSSILWGGTFAEATVSGNNFSGTLVDPVGSSTFNGGSLSGTTMALSVTDDDGEVISFSGTKPSSGAGPGGGGYSGDTDYSTGVVAVNVNGKAFSLTECEGGLNSGNMVINGDDALGQDGELELALQGIDGTGTYAIVGYTWTDERPDHIWDAVTATVSGAVTIIAVDASSVSGSIDFSHNGLTMKGSFNMSK